MKRENTWNKLNYVNLDDISTKTWPEPKKFNPLFARNCLCDICSQVGGLFGDIILPCIYCNVIMHFSCLYKAIGKPGSIEEAFSIKDNFICFYCLDSLDNSLNTFESEKNFAAKFRTLNDSQTTIAKHWRRYYEQKRFVKIYSLILHIQLLYRLNKRKTLFLEKRFVKLRPLKIKIIKCDNVLIAREKSNLSQNNNQVNPTPHNKTAPVVIIRPTIVPKYEYFVTVTVMDMANGNHNQRWLVITDSFPASSVKPTSTQATITFDKELMLAGVSGSQTVVLSVFQNGLKRPHFIGKVISF